MFVADSANSAMLTRVSSLRDRYYFYMSFLFHTVAIPVWLLIMMIAAMIPLFVEVYALLMQLKRKEIVKEEDSDLVVWKVRSPKQSISPKKTVEEFAREKRHEEKSDIVHVLKIMAHEGDKGILIQSVADRMNVALSKTQSAMKKLVDKKLVEEVVGVSGTKYYLTQLGRNYCTSKGIV